MCVVISVFVCGNWRIVGHKFAKKFSWCEEFRGKCGSFAVLRQNGQDKYIHRIVYPLSVGNLYRPVRNAVLSVRSRYKLNPSRLFLCLVASELVVLDGQPLIGSVDCGRGCLANRGDKAREGDLPSGSPARRGHPRYSRNRLLVVLDSRRELTAEKSDKERDWRRSQ